MVVGTARTTALTVCLIYMAGFMGFDAQCKMVVGTTPTTAWRLQAEYRRLHARVHHAYVPFDSSLAFTHNRPLGFNMQFFIPNRFI